ncbi:MAG: hypothetical protein K0S24_1897 [Sphingobacterium sp.]|nr:hypothetical protein [Sphingobacterium sp.]
MVTENKILILCDSHDFVRNGTNVVFLKQLYVAVFILKHILGIKNHNIHINNRSLFGFEEFWEPNSKLLNFFEGHCFRNTWNEIDMLNYEIIICIPELQMSLKEHIVQNYGRCNDLRLISFTEVQYPCEMIFSEIGTLFTKGGLFEFERSSANIEAISEFKKEINRSLVNFDYAKQESLIPELLPLVSDFNERVRSQSISDILILDDYCRPAFIGDTFFWLSRLRSLLKNFPDYCRVTINIVNPIVYEIVCECYRNSLPERIKLLNISWEYLFQQNFDIILCYKDIFLKYLWYLRSCSFQISRTIFYTFMVDNPGIESKGATLDFNANIPYIKYGDRLINSGLSYKSAEFREIALTDQEIDWGDKWLEHYGVSETDKLHIFLLGSSSSKKVISDLEVSYFLKYLLQQDSSNKIILVNENSLNEKKWLRSSLESFVNQIVPVENLALRKVMCLIGNRNVKTVIGPCTGLMHLADGIYSNLINHNVIAAADCPLLLTYTGQQESERSYHPNNWWGMSKLTQCCVAMKNAAIEGEAILLPLSKCPMDYMSFQEQSVSADTITCDMLVEYLETKCSARLDLLGLVKKRTYLRGGV